MKTTKEQWYVVEYGGFFRIQTEPYYDAGKNIMDAEVVGYETAKANAQLMATSPDMLKVLQECEAQITNHESGHHHQFQELRGLIKAVIRRATNLNIL